MKKWFLTACFGLCGMTFSACTGDNGAHSGRPDTVGNRYGSANDTNGSANRTIDTGKVISKDYSGSGGTVRNADTSKYKDTSKRMDSVKTR